LWLLQPNKIIQQIYTTFPTSIHISHIFSDPYSMKVFKVCGVGGLWRVERLLLRDISLGIGQGIKILPGPAIAAYNML
jgi:hypothetical protein